jgi:hypothetical protein
MGAASVVTREVLPASNYLKQFGVSSSTRERVRRGNKENNGSNSGADADDDNITSEIRPASEAIGIPSEFERAETASRSADDLGKEFGVSGSTIERVRTILDQATPEQIQALRAKSESGEGQASARCMSSFNQTN